MSKVLLISGSPKLEGNTAQLMEECAKVIRERGMTLQVIGGDQNRCICSQQFLVSGSRSTRFLHRMHNASQHSSEHKLMNRI